MSDGRATVAGDDAAAGTGDGAVRIAAVDMGSNTTRLIVADTRLNDAGRRVHEPIVRRSTITRLAEGVDARGILLPEPITRVRNALVEYRREARELGAVLVLATATSAVRDADNGEAFLGEVEHGFGFRAELLDGDQEAQATWRGVTSDPSMAARAGAGSGWLIDIGGGSTEVVLSDAGTLVDHHSFQLGSVRLTERFLGGARHDARIDRSALAAARAAVASELADRFGDAATPQLAIGVAGTATTVSAILLDRASYDPDAVHGFSFTRVDVERMLDRLAGMQLEARRQVRGLEPDRAPVICGGLLVLAEAMRHFGIERMETSERDILDGIALMAGDIAAAEGVTELPEPFGRTVC